MYFFVILKTSSRMQIESFSSQSASRFSRTSIQIYVSGMPLSGRDKPRCNEFILIKAKPAGFISLLPF
jgi:hypothetical protein